MRKSAPVSFGSVRVTMPVAAPGRRIGLLGGSFNPPHAAHRLVSKIAIRRLGLDAVWWLATPGNPLKARDGLPPLAERMATARTLKADARIVVTGFEAALATPFTAATLAFLRRRHPATRFVWLMGADNLAQFHRWRHWRDIFRLMPVAVIDRPGWHLKGLASPAARAFSACRRPETRARTLPLAKPPAWVMLSGPLSPLSSTALRAARKP